MQLQPLMAPTARRLKPKWTIGSARWRRKQRICFGNKEITNQNVRKRQIRQSERTAEVRLCLGGTSAGALSCRYQDTGQHRQERGERKCSRVGFVRSVGPRLWKAAADHKHDHQ